MVDTPVTVPPAPAATTKPWQSKTLWVAILTAVIPLIPGVGPLVSGWIGANPQTFSAGLGAVFAALRLITQNKVVIS